VLALAAFGMQRTQDLLPGLIAGDWSRAFQRHAAAPAKTCGRAVQMTAGSALGTESGAASFTILIGRLVVAAATQTRHQDDPGPQKNDGIQQWLGKAAYSMLLRKNVNDPTHWRLFPGSNRRRAGWRAVPDRIGSIGRL
jgi:hypothetical protein